MTKIIFPAELAVAVPVANESAPAISGDFWFYVPKGTVIWGFMQKPAGAGCSLRMENGFSLCPERTASANSMFPPEWTVSLGRSAE